MIFFSFHRVKLVLMVTRLPISLLYDRYFAMVVMPMCLPCYQSSNLFFWRGYEPLH